MREDVKFVVENDVENTKEDVTISKWRTTLSNKDAFVGRGEESAKRILEKLFDYSGVRKQVSLLQLIPYIPEEILGTEQRKHKFDLYVAAKSLVIEVNFKHGRKAYEKWGIYKDYVEAAGYKTMVIEANECKHLFESDPANLTWQDYIDVINALDNAGIKP